MFSFLTYLSFLLIYGPKADIFGSIYFFANPPGLDRRAGKPRQETAWERALSTYV